MSKNIQVKPQVNRLIKFITDIEEGKFKIPTFQRDFVWGSKEKIDLFDSISKGYPIGSILLWQPNEEFKSKAEIGPYQIEKTSFNDYFYILDGFQRLSTLFGCLTNPFKTTLNYDSNKLIKEYSLLYNLEDEYFTFSNYESKKATNIPVYILIDTYALLDYLDDLRGDINNIEKSNLYVSRAKKLSSTLIDYHIPSIEIYGGTIKDAVDIFSRINSKGITISQDWMLSALTSNESVDFNLGEILGALLFDLKEYNFGDLKRDTLVQCIQNSFGKVYYDQKLEDLAVRPNFKDVAYNTVESIKKSVKFLFEELLVVDRKLLPYNIQLVFLTHFFNNHQDISENQKRKLKDWFWYTTYSNYFTVNSLSKIRLAFEQFKHFVENENNEIIYDSNVRLISADLPNNISAKSVRSTAFVLFQINYYNNFKKIDNNDEIRIETVYIKKGDSSHGNVIHRVKFDTINKQQSFHQYISSHNDIDFKKCFITEKIITLFNNGNFEDAIKERLVLISQEERKFVSDLNIDYSI
jgi:hypothetical protein